MEMKVSAIMLFEWIKSTSTILVIKVMHTVTFIHAYLKCTGILLSKIKKFKTIIGDNNGARSNTV